MSALSHTQAAQIVKQEWERIYGRPSTSLETLFMMAIGWLETHYGRAGQFASWPEQGFYNWGNLTANKTSDGMCPVGSKSGGDTYDGKPVTACFRVFGSDAEAANAMIRNLTKRHWPVAQAIADEGTAEAVAHAMKVSPAYYTAPESQYVTGIKNAASAIGKELKTTTQETVKKGVDTATSHPGLILGAIAVLGVGGFAAYKHYEKG